MDSAYCFPVSDKEIVIRLRTAANDIKEAYIIYESKYQIGQHQQKELMTKTGTGKLFDYYSIHLQLEDTRLAYVFYLYDGQNYYYFSEDGATKDYDFTKGYYNFFQYPYINKSTSIKRPTGSPRVAFIRSSLTDFVSEMTRKIRATLILSGVKSLIPRALQAAILRALFLNLITSKILAVMPFI